MLTLAGHLFGCLFWGLLIALILTGISIFIAKGISNKTPNFIVAAVLFILLAYQSILAVGSLYARSYVEDVRQLVEDIVASAPDSESTAELAETVSENFPAIPEKIIKNMADLNETTSNVRNIADQMANSLKKSLTSYLWERIAWASGFMIIGIVLLVKVPGNGSSGRKGRGGYHTSLARDKYADLDY